jgi:hypothetical protein
MKKAEVERVSSGPLPNSTEPEEYDVVIFAGGIDPLFSSVPDRRRAFHAHPDSIFINSENLTVDGGWNA